MDTNGSLRQNETDVSDVRRDQNVMMQATSFMTYRVGEVINDLYFPILIPFGIIGNILSFLVMTQKHNRHMSFSLYIAVLAVTDTVTLIVAFCGYLDNELKIKMPPNQLWHCSLTLGFSLSSSLCSTLLILAMTFERFYSIIRPHKTASFNTVKRAKITIVCIVMFSFTYNLPHFFITTIFGDMCVAYGKILHEVYGKIYYWFGFTVNFAFPFVSLLTMNSVIIHTLRKRLQSNTSHIEGQGQTQGQIRNEGQSSKLKTSERQIYVTLLLVTFTFLVLTTPIYVYTVSTMLYDHTQTAKSFADFFLFFMIAPKLYYTNCGVNFFLYVMSGQKFRNDLLNLFKCTSRLSQPNFTETKVTQLSAEEHQ